MGKYVLQRVVAMLLTILCIITITFFLMHAIPGGPFTRERPLPDAILNALNKKYHLDDPVWKQYANYLEDLVLKGDFGPSFRQANRSVNELIGSGFPVTAKLGLASIALTLIIAIPMGIYSALKQGKWQDYTAMFIATLGVTIPGFVMAILLIYIFALKLEILPVISGSLDTAITMVLPVLALTGFQLSFITRLMRSSMLDVIQQDYIRTARAKGISEFKVLMKHAFKNAILPVITYMGPMVAALLTGSFVIERMFTIPGMGGFFVTSIGNRDYTMIMGSTIFYAAILIVMNFVVDILYGFVDPRIKLQNAKGGAA